ncbi:MAG: RNA methyltransferase [Coriobacteriales bacterium]|nr:RNA methyltransferase [Coriobacteriales bacterium]
MATLRMSTLADKRLEVYTKLTNHQLRSAWECEHGIMIVESQIAIRVALEARMRPLSFLLSEQRLQAMADVVDSLDDDVPVFVLPPDQMERLCGFRVTRGALCAMERPRPLSVDQLLDEARRLVVVEGVTDTSNIGAIFRNAAALGADGVLVAPTCADPLVRRAIRVSMGNVFRVPWCRADGAWPTHAMNALSERGFLRLALALASDAVSLDDPSLREASKVALCFGSEGAGLTQAVLDACDKKVIIPMAHGVDSLNVAASSAVAMWELFR